jgi:hypothetical protein
MMAQSGEELKLVGMSFGGGENGTAILASYSAVIAPTAWSLFKSVTVFLFCNASIVIIASDQIAGWDLAIKYPSVLTPNILISHLSIQRITGPKKPRRVSYLVIRKIA